MSVRMRHTDEAEMPKAPSRHSGKRERLSDTSKLRNNNRNGEQLCLPSVATTVILEEPDTSKADLPSLPQHACGTNTTYDETDVSYSDCNSLEHKATRLRQADDTTAAAVQEPRFLAIDAPKSLPRDVSITPKSRTHGPSSSSWMTKPVEICSPRGYRSAPVDFNTSSSDSWDDSITDDANNAYETQREYSLFDVAGDSRDESDEVRADLEYDECRDQVIDTMRTVSLDFHRSHSHISCQEEQSFRSSLPKLAQGPQSHLKVFSSNNGGVGGTSTTAFDSSRWMDRLSLTPRNPVAGSEWQSSSKVLTEEEFLQSAEKLEQQKKKKNVAKPLPGRSDSALYTFLKTLLIPFQCGGGASQELLADSAI